MPRLSIITVNLNNLAGLKKTMQSVFEQTFTDYEYIIIDGGSTDGSREYIEQYADKLAYWVSEKDGGIFNAMNKGIKASNGEYLFFENSGDYLYSKDVLENVFVNKPIEDIIYGNVKWWPEDYYGEYPDLLTFEHFRYNTIPHQGAFIKSILFKKNGFYDETYTVDSDWIFFLLAIFKYNCSYYHINEIISYCNTDGLSFSESSRKRTPQIRESIFNKYFRAFNEELKSLEQIKKENIKYKNILNQRIMKIALIINNQYHKLRKRIVGRSIKSI